MADGKPMYQCGTPERRVVYAWEGEVDGLRAEIERLRAALREIIDLRPEDMPHAVENSMAAAIARATLNPSVLASQEQ